MKQLFLSAAACLLLASSALATKHTVTVQDFSFSPKDLTIKLGDTVVWTWLNGSHTTTSKTIPAGAAAWDAPMTSSSPAFTYKPAVAGVYNYKCTPHESMGHVGTITVTPATSVPATAAEALFSLSPNPAAGNLHLAFNTAAAQSSITITDALGRIVRSASYSGSMTADIPTSGLANGLYIIRAVSGDKEYAQSFEVAH